jgi:hypothetical protein
MSSLSSYGKGDEKKLSPIRLNSPQHPIPLMGRVSWTRENFVRLQDYFPYVILRPQGCMDPVKKIILWRLKVFGLELILLLDSYLNGITFIYVKIWHAWR